MTDSRTATPSKQDFAGRLRGNAAFLASNYTSLTPDEAQVIVRALESAADHVEAFFAQSASGATTENPEAERMIRELLDDCDKGGWWMIQPKLKKLLDVVRQQPKKCTPTATREPNACPICGTDFPHNHRWPWAVADNPTRPTMIENLLSQDEQGRAALASAAIEEAREQLRLIIEAPENRWHSRQWMKESARLALKALQDIPSASAPSATASPVGKTDHFSDNREPDAWLEVHEGSDEVLDATLIKPDDGEPGVRYVPLYSAAPAKEIEVIDPYVMDLVREHGSTMTNSEIVQKFLPKRSLPSATRAPSEPAWVWGLKQEGIRDEVAQFAALMERKLKANDHKDHWSDSGMSYLLKRLREELVELERILLAQSVPTTEEVAGEAADVANFAMMIADNFGALPHLPALPVSSDSGAPSATTWEPWQKPMTVTDTMLSAAKKAEPKVGREAALRIYRAMLDASDRGNDG